MTKSKRDQGIEIINMGEIEITGNCGAYWVLKNANRATESWELLEDNKIPKDPTHILPARPYAFKVPDPENPKKSITKVAYELSVFPSNRKPAKVVSVACFDDSQAWVEGIAYDDAGAPIDHKQLRKGDRVKVTGYHSIKVVTDLKTHEVRRYHRLAVNFATDIVRVHKVKRLSFAEAHKALNPKTA